MATGASSSKAQTAASAAAATAAAAASSASTASAASAAAADSSPVKVTYHPIQRTEAMDPLALQLCLVFLKLVCFYVPLILS